uniref:Family with sequence similarity 219 member Aa n=1 Tax=Poecilia reticulata TaxID=8081 RepID=A0A3P9NGN0_POERE
MMEEIDRFQVPSAVQEAEMQSEMQPLDPASSTASEAESDTREGEAVTINYKPSPLQMKIEKQRDLARKGSLKNNNTVGSPVNQQPKKNNVMARTRLVVPNKGYSSLDQSPDEKPLVALDTDSDDDFDMSRYSSSGYSSAELSWKRDHMNTKNHTRALVVVIKTKIQAEMPAAISNQSGSEHPAAERWLPPRRDPRRRGPGSDPAQISQPHLHVLPGDLLHDLPNPVTNPPPLNLIIKTAGPLIPHKLKPAVFIRCEFTSPPEWQNVRHL